MTDPKEKTTPWGNVSPVPAHHITENDINNTPTTTPAHVPNTAPTTTPIPAPSNKDDYNQQMVPHRITYDRKHHRYNTRDAKGYAQLARKIMDNENLSDAKNNITNTNTYNGFINHVIHPVTGKHCSYT